MKVLFENMPLSCWPTVAHRSKSNRDGALGNLSMTVEPLRWWDEAQTGDVLHHFARIPIHLQRLAKGKGMKLVMSAFMSGLGARPAWQRLLQKLAFRVIKPVAPRRLQIFRFGLLPPLGRDDSDDAL